MRHEIQAKTVWPGCSVSDACAWNLRSDFVSDCPAYEVDFLIQRENDILPVEVKSESNVDSKSLRKFKEKFGDKVKLRIRFSLDNLKLDDDLLNIPLFMADFADRLIGLALANK